MAALRDWASEFEAAHGRRPTVWLDKGSIDQTSVAADLAGLPLYLLGCRSLLVLVGNTYGSRLWCACTHDARTHAHTHARTHARTHMHTHTHTHTHTHIHTHTHTHTHSHSQLVS